MNIYAMKKPKRFNSVSVGIGIVTLIVGYLLYFIVPVYWPIFQLGGIMRGICNDAYRIHSDEQLMKKLVKDTRRTKLKITKENFRLTRVGWTEEEIREISKGNVNIQAIMRKRGKECVLEMHYEDDYTWPFIGKTSHLVFESTAKAPLDQVNWEKQCTCVTPGPTD